MYLISIYFDEETNKKIQAYINVIAKSTGNTYMIEGQVPPHITISSIEAKRESEDQIVHALEESVQKLIQADSAPALVKALKSVLFPTLGSPTIPSFIFKNPTFLIRFVFHNQYIIQHFC